MANKMLIDASHPEETRVVVLRGNRVEEFDFESASKKPLRGNIYLAKVTRVEPSLQAAFVDYGGNRHGFLAFSEIHPDYYQIPVADRQALLEEEAAAHEEEEEEQRPRRSRRRRNREQDAAKRQANGDESISEAAPLADDGTPADEQDSAGDVPAELEATTEAETAPADDLAVAEAPEVVPPAAPFDAEAGNYRLDPHHTSVLWKVDHLGGQGRSAATDRVVRQQKRWRDRTLAHQLPEPALVDVVCDGGVEPDPTHISQTRQKPRQIPRRRRAGDVAEPGDRRHSGRGIWNQQGVEGRGLFGCDGASHGVQRALASTRTPGQADPFDTGGRGKDHAPFSEAFDDSVDNRKSLVGRPGGLGRPVQGEGDVAGLESAYAEVGRDIPPVLQARFGPSAIGAEQRLRQAELVGQVGEEFSRRRLIVPESEAWVAQQRHPGRGAQTVGVTPPGRQKVEVIGPERVVARQGGALGRDAEQRRPFLFCQQLASGHRRGLRSEAYAGVGRVASRRTRNLCDTCADP